jgi:pyrroloquinoline quinone (PQQ) biosynthesis protein C
MNEQLSSETSTQFVPNVGSGPVAPAEAIVDVYERREVSSHSFFVGLRARSVDLQAIWVLVANLRAGISRDFVIWVAETIARVDDRRIASLLAKQLNDELGSGDFAEIHSVLLDRFLLGLEPWRPHGSDDAILWPGRRLADRGNQLFAGPNAYEAIGALMVGEIFAKKMDHCLGDEIRRQNAISVHALHWLTIHEVLEVDHADDSRDLAKLVPADEAVLAAAWRGATAQWQALWEFLDGVEAVAAARGS